MKKRIRAAICKIDGILIQDSLPMVDNLQQLKEWRQQGMQLAAVSASKNYQQVLNAADLGDLFDIIMPIEDPANPDSLLYIASLLNIPSEQVMVVDDSPAGITAAKRGGFGLAVAILHFNNQNLLDKSNPDVLISQLKELFWTGISIRYPQNYQRVPNLISHIENLLPITNTPLAVFLDYDGTLTPIIQHFEQAELNAKMQQVLALLAQKASVVAIVSGRDKAVLKDFVKQSTIFYVGNHGFDIEGPEETGIHHQMGDDFVRVLKNFFNEIQKALAAIPGVQVETEKIYLSGALS